MDLLFITECYNHKLGGLSRYERTLVDGIKQLKRNHGVSIKHISEIKKPSRISQIITFFSYNLLKPAKENSADVVHLLNQQLVLTLNFVPFANTAVTVHDLAFFVPAYFKELSLLDKLRYKLVIRGLQRADWIITDAEFTKTEIVKYVGFPEKQIYVVPLGVDLSIFKKKRLTTTEWNTYRCHEKGPVILYVGSEISRMNLPILLKAINLLRIEFPSISLIKIGEAKSESSRKELLHLITTLQLDKHIHFVEHVSEVDLVSYYNTADVFVYPIAYTGFGLPPLEAMACGCPVITTTTSTLPEVVHDAALLFDPDNVEQLRDAIASLLKDKTLKKRMIQKGFSWVKKRTWDQCIKKTLQTYDCL